MEEALTLKEEFLSLLEHDREFRYAIAGLLGLKEILLRLDEHGERMVKLGEEMVKLEERMVKLEEGMVRLGEELVRLREDMVAGFKRHDEEFAKVWNELARFREDMNRGFMLLERHISALGARWGLMSEEAFREGIKGLVEKEFGFRAERWVKFDGEGFVYGYPSQVEVDVAVHDGRLILVEVKAHVGVSDVYMFKRKAEFYERVEGKHPQRLVMVTPYADDKAIEASRRLGVEIYTKV
ncbi:DUF3782 domain-containing protein [Candidatus Bathyarchaeota archaeon]|nr:DUF3782 domain-containing protein [Candidatus Bathyarchaeota archaeon]